MPDIDPTDDVREDLHDAVDQAVDDAERQQSIEARFDLLERRLNEGPQVIQTPADLSGVEAAIAALGERFESRLTALEASATRAPAPGPDSDGDDDAKEAVEDVADAVEDAGSLDERIASQGNLKVELPEIPERPPIKANVHPIFRRLFGGK